MAEATSLRALADVSFTEAINVLFERWPVRSLARDTAEYPPHASRNQDKHADTQNWPVVSFDPDRAQPPTFMTTLSNTTAENAQQMLDFQVVDQTGAEIGTVHSFWANAHTGNLEFVGVKTGWLFGHNHVIPVEKVELDEAGRTVRVPYASEFVKGAPSIDADATISDEEESEIYRYYQAGGMTGRTTTERSSLGGTAASAESSVKNTASEAGTAIKNTAATAGAALGLNTAANTNTTARATTATGKDDIEVALTEEQVHVGKRTVDAGQVRLRKIVRTEVVNQPVEIRHEDVVIERVSADQVHAGTDTSDFTEQTIDVPLTREEVVVSKDAHVTGAVRLHKTEGVEQQQVSETVRKEDVEVVRDGKTVTDATDVRKS